MLINIRSCAVKVKFSHIFSISCTTFSCLKNYRVDNAFSRVCLFSGRQGKFCSEFIREASSFNSKYHNNVKIMICKGTDGFCSPFWGVNIHNCLSHSQFFAFSGCILLSSSCSCSQFRENTFLFPAALNGSP